MNALKEVAEAIDIALLNGIALGTIQDYSVEIVHDDYAINVKYVKVAPCDHIKFTLQVGREIDSSIEHGDKL